MNEELNFCNERRRAHKLVKRGIYKYHMQEAGSQKNKANLYIHDHPVNLRGQELVWVHDTLLQRLSVSLYSLHIQLENLRGHKDP